MIFRVGPEFHLYFAALVTVFGILVAIPGPWSLVAIVLLFGSVGLCVRMCSTAQFTYVGGLYEIISYNMSGIAIITMLWMCPTIIVVHLLCSAAALEGLLKGKCTTAARWDGMVTWFYYKRFGKYTR